MGTDPVSVSGGNATTDQAILPAPSLHLLAGTGGFAARASAHWFFSHSMHTVPSGCARRITIIKPIS